MLHGGKAAASRERERVLHLNPLNREDFDWSELLHRCYCEESYESVGGDEGYLDNPPINHERLTYLGTMVKLLEDNGMKAE